MLLIVLFLIDLGSYVLYYDYAVIILLDLFHLTMATKIKLQSAMDFTVLHVILIM